MRLILLDCVTPWRENFYPLAFSRPIWELRCGMTSLGEKLIAKTGAREVAGFLPEYMADAYREGTSWPINQLASLAGDDLLLVDARVKADAFDVLAGGAEPSRVRCGRQLLVSHGSLARTWAN